MCNAEKFGTPLVDLPASEWPWWVHQIVSHVATVKSVHERASMTKVPVPPRYMWWEHEELDAYFDRERK